MRSGCTICRVILQGQQVLQSQRGAPRIKFTNAGERCLDTTGNSTREKPKNTELIFACSNCAFGFSKIDLFLVSRKSFQNGKRGVVSGSSILKMGNPKSEGSCSGKRGKGFWGASSFPDLALWPRSILQDNVLFCSQQAYNAERGKSSSWPRFRACCGCTGLQVNYLNTFL